MTDRDDQLDAELRRLFDDERLGLLPKPDAAQSVVAGARRIRRRRAAMAGSGGALVVLALVGGGLLLGGQRQPMETPDAHIAAPPAGTGGTSSVTTTAQPTSPPQVRSLPGTPPVDSSSESESPATSSRQSTARTTSSLPPDASTLRAAPVFGPESYQKLTLGMSYRDAAATGMLAGADQSPPPENACSTYRLAEGATAIRDVTISGSAGVVVIRAGEAVTPEGIGAGSSLDQVRAAYPDLASESAGYSASAGANSRYFFTASDDSVTEVQLRASGSSC
ncbi:hypothetical protein [Prauserella muralis]|uniref:Uncharacterized protein n=1 Tax=Prauserella muralis TaxID=588067 RepID=A0A2V4B956_9PSEU|nr:hypothetical protein [Prauserella muralis]PXY31797.1 hypothetical protein BAY60_05500 [Prauserella muralis]TWE13803.1 hypothetical protein FHX69_5931 [Prauserella muralis]